MAAQPLGPRPKGKRARGNAPKFDLPTELYRITGVDWTRVDGIDVQVAQSVIAEVGVDLSAFPSEKHFANFTPEELALFKQWIDAGAPEK